MQYHPLNIVLTNNLCAGCGVCSGVCPAQAITMQRHDSVWQPYVAMELCRKDKGCSLCYDVCPGHSVDIENSAKSLFPDNVFDKNIGRYRKCYTGYATEYDIRYHAASGGVTTQILLWLLENRIIEGAVVTRYSADAPLIPQAFIATTREEIIMARSSKYCPVSIGDSIQNILKLKGKVAVVGLPCHIHGFRKAEKKIPQLKERVYIYIGLYCSSTKTFNATEYLFKQLGVKAQDVQTFSYRDEGCLGNMVVRLRNGLVKRWAFQDYYPSIRSFFISYRCTLCIDHAAEMADISIGDIHIPEYWDDKVGINSFIVRSIRAEKVIADMFKLSLISVKDLDVKLLIKSQIAMIERKKRHQYMRRLFNKVLGLKVPDYGTVISFPRTLGVSVLFKQILAVMILYLEIFIGKNRALWWIIRILNACLIIGKTT